MESKKIKGTVTSVRDYEEWLEIRVDVDCPEFSQNLALIPKEDRIKIQASDEYKTFLEKLNIFKKRPSLGNVEVVYPGDADESRT